MSPPAILPMLLNQTRMNLPNLDNDLDNERNNSSKCKYGSICPSYPFLQLTHREELSFLTVLALPYASSTGLVCTTWSSREAFFFSPSFSFLPGMDVFGGIGCLKLR